jgi:hypothetical protein
MEILDESFKDFLDEEEKNKKLRKLNGKDEGIRRE